MQHQYEYFMSDTLDLPKDVWLPFSAAVQPLSYPKGKLLYSQGEQADCFYYL